MFTSTATRSGDDICLTLAGELDLADQSFLHQSITRARTGSAATLRIDMRDVSFIDCAIISALIEEHLDAAAAGTRLILINPQGLVLRVLRVLDLLTHLTEPIDPIGLPARP